MSLNENEKKLLEEQRRKSWDFALSVNEMSGRKVSKEFMEMVEKEISGEISGEDFDEWLHQKGLRLAEESRKKMENQKQEKGE